MMLTSYAKAHATPSRLVVYHSLTALSRLIEKSFSYEDTKKEEHRRKAAVLFFRYGGLLTDSVADRTLVLYENVRSFREEDAADLLRLYLNASVVVVPLLDSVASRKVRCVDMHLSEGVVAETDALVTAGAECQSEYNEG